MNLCFLIWMLGRDADELIRFLGDLPENWSVRGYVLHNNSFKMLWLYRSSTCVMDGAWNESEKDSRADLASDTWERIDHLRVYIDMMMELENPYWFSRHGIRRAHEWRLLRFLAQQIDIPKKLGAYRVADFTTLFTLLGTEEAQQCFEVDNGSSR